MKIRRPRLPKRVFKGERLRVGTRYQMISKPRQDGLLWHVGWAVLERRPKSGPSSGTLSREGRSAWSTKRNSSKHAGADRGGREGGAGRGA